MGGRSSADDIFDACQKDVCDAFVGYIIIIVGGDFQPDCVQQRYISTIHLHRQLHFCDGNNVA